MSSLTEGFLQLGIKQAALFREMPDQYLDCLVTLPSQRSVMFNVYAFLKCAGKIRSIESLPESERRDIWKQAKELAKDRLPVEKLPTLARCLYCLECLLSYS